MTSFMLSVYNPADSYDREFGTYDSAAEMEAAFARTAELNDALEDEGVLVYVGGLNAPALAVTVDPSGLESDGPAGGSGAVLGGFWVIDTDTFEEAAEVAQRAAVACGQSIEIRQFEG
ncbi:YciI family protein [Corynebacterium pacaense]|uniref:YciI family protein n=1 Tax=Corynebacterium pacaense TaxID=1816684 RepID=UPI0009BB2BFD|nr:YciI family protein [Corynebacterium pacaense]